MISDVLAEAIAEIDRYLSDPVFADVYEGALRSDIVELRNKMDGVRERLDTPPIAADEKRRTL